MYIYTYIYINDVYIWVICHSVSCEFEGQLCLVFSNFLARLSILSSTAWKVLKYGFSCVQTEYGDLLRKSPYSVRIQENTDQKKLRIRTLFTQCLVYGASESHLWNYSSGIFEKSETDITWVRISWKIRKDNWHFVG